MCQRRSLSREKRVLWHISSVLVNSVVYRKKLVPALHPPRHKALFLHSIPSALRPHIHTLVLPSLNILQGPLEVLPWTVQPADVLCSIKIALNKLNQAVNVFGRHGIVLLVKIVDVAVENFDEELDAHGCVHAGVCDAESALEALEHAFAVAVELGYFLV